MENEESLDVIEIDLRKYIALAINYWKIIITSAIIFGVAIYIYSYLQPKIYEASAGVIAITPLPNQSNLSSNYKAYADIIENEQVLSKVYSTWIASHPDSISYRKFTNSVRVREGSDLSILVLNVSLDEPEVAAVLANLWAVTATEQINAIQTAQDDNQLAYYQNLRSEVLDRLSKAGQAYIDFRQNSNYLLVVADLENALDEYQKLVIWERNLSNLDLEMQNFLSGLEAGDYDATSGSAQLSFYFLEVFLQTHDFSNPKNAVVKTEGFGIAGSVIEKFPSSSITVSLSNPDFSSLTVDDQKALVEQLRNDIAKKKELIESRLDPLAASIPNLEKNVKDLDAQQDMLLTEYNMARDDFSQISNDLFDAQITEGYRWVSIAYEANPPRSPIDQNTLRNTAFGAVVGASVAYVILLVLDWWRESRSI